MHRSLQGKVFYVAILALATGGCTPLYERGALQTLEASARRPELARAQSWSTPTAAPVDRIGDQAGAEIPSHDPDALVAWGLERHPRIKSQLAAIEGSQARTRQASSLPEPRLSVAPIGNMAQTAAGEVTVMAGISQTFPAPGALSARTVMADADTQQIIAQLAFIEVEVAKGIRQTWWRWKAAHEGMDTVVAQLAVIDRLVIGLQSRVENNQARQGELIRIRLEQNALRTEMRRWQEQREVAAAALRAALSVDENALLVAPSSAPASALTSSLSGDYAWFLQTAQERRPDYARNDAAQANAAGMALAARARRRPEFTISAQYNRVDDEGLSAMANGDDQWWLGVGVSLPVWFGTYAAADQEARSASTRAEWERRGIDNSVVAEVRSAWLERESTRDQLRIFETDLLPDAERALNLEEEAYATGVGTYLDLIGAWRRSLALRIQAVRLRQSLGMAEAQLLASSGLVHPVHANHLPPDSNQQSPAQGEHP